MSLSKHFDPEAAKHQPQIDDNTTPHHDNQSCYTLVPAWREKAFELAARYHITPTRDAFANKANHTLPKFWTEENNTLKQYWTPEQHLWMNPPWKLIPHTIEKLVEERVKGIIVIPRWERAA